MIHRALLPQCTDSASVMLRQSSISLPVVAPARLIFRSRASPPIMPRNLCLQRRAFLIRSKRPRFSALSTMDVDALLAAQHKRRIKRLAFLSAALVASLTMAVYTSVLIFQRLNEDAGTEQKSTESGVAPRRSGTVASSFEFPSQLTGSSDSSKKSSTKILADAPPNTPGVPVGSKVILRNPEGADLVPTGNSAVPHFPRTIQLPDTMGSGQDVEYTLVGLGIRSVTLLRFQVYVVGLYVATQDVSGVQKRLIKHINPIATTLVPDERDKLRLELIDSTVASDELWIEALFPARTALRIAPVRETNFPHMRDGFVRAINARRDKDATADEEFTHQLRKFKQAFDHGKLPTASELLLQRSQYGKLTMSYINSKGSGSRVVMAEIIDPRISTPLWLNYLTGKVASPAARESIVNGMLDFVERPVGTVATQVV